MTSASASASAVPQKLISASTKYVMAGTECAMLELRNARPPPMNDNASLRSDTKWLSPINTLVMQHRVEKVVFQHIRSTLRAS